MRKVKTPCIEEECDFAVYGTLAETVIKHSKHYESEHR